MSRSPLVSVVIATRDRPEVLKQCLERLFDQSYELFEIVVVDNSADLSTGQVVREFPVVYVRENPGHSNPARMRNQGIARSKGDILALIDDDTLVLEGWMRSLVAAFDDPDLGGVTGRVMESGVPVVTTTEIGQFSPRGELTMNFDNLIPQSVPVDFMYGCNMAVCRSALQEAGAYDPWLGIIYEEQDLSFRIRAAGYKLLFVPDMAVEHLKAPRPHGVVQRPGRFDPKSLFASCRSLAYLCVSHFGLRMDFATVAFINLPKAASRRFVKAPSLSGLLAILATVGGGLVGYLMACARRLSLHLPPPL
jgi:cellulose synthase/poly-beta-1,6-N-acetylglucosamine synthase-like glycosyltransferase